MTINSDIVKKQQGLGRIVIAECVSGQPSLNKTSNCRAVAEAYIRRHPTINLQQCYVIPGARNRYRSEGFKNVIVAIIEL